LDWNVRYVPSVLVIASAMVGAGAASLAGPITQTRFWFAT
jgi:hypothetical protein